MQIIQQPMCLLLGIEARLSIRLFFGVLRRAFDGCLQLVATWYKYINNDVDCIHNKYIGKIFSKRLIWFGVVVILYCRVSNIVFEMVILNVLL